MSTLVGRFAEFGRFLGGVTPRGWGSIGLIAVLGGGCTPSGRHTGTGPSPIAGGETLWSRSWGTAANNESGGPFAVDPANNVVVSGKFAGTLDWGDGPHTAIGPTDVFVARFDPDGATFATSQFGGPLGTDGTAVVGPQRETVLGGSFSGSIDFGLGAMQSAGGSDLYLAKLDATGAPAWSKRFGDAGDQNNVRLAVGPDGSIFFGAFSMTAIDLGQGPSSTLDLCGNVVAKFGPDGQLRWAKAFQGTLKSWGGHLRVDAAGDLIMDGETTGTVDFGGGPLVGSPTVNDVFVAKFDADGNYLWAKRLTGDWGGGAVPDADGNIYFAGAFSRPIDLGGGPLVSAGSTDVFLVKWTPDGQHLWSHRYGDAGAQWGHGVAVDSHGNVVVSGLFATSIDLGTGEVFTAVDTAGDCFIFKASSNGDPLWARQFGGPGLQWCVDVHVDGEDAVLVTGAFENTVDFGAGPMTSAGALDAYVAKLTP
jgi:hypothetical protein